MKRGFLLSVGMVLILVVLTTVSEVKSQSPLLDRPYGDDMIPRAWLPLVRQVKSQSPLLDRPYLIGWYEEMNRPQVLAEHAASGGSIVLPYGGAEFSDNEIDSHLDEAQRLGMKVIMDLHYHPDQVGGPSAEELGRKAARHKDHPALYGWYIADEPEFYSAETPEYIQTIYDAVKSADPNHPIMLIHYSQTYDEWANAMDVLMTNWYPGWSLYDPEEFNWMVRRSYDVWLDGVSWVKQHGKQGFIAVPLGFGTYENGSPNNGTRDLTYAEYRYHVFSAVVLDTDALIFWQNYGGFAPNSRIKPIIDQIIGQVQSMGAEMSNGTTNDPRITVSESQDRLVYRYGVNGDRQVILAVNIVRDSSSGANLSNVQFTLPGDVSPSEVEVLGEGRTIPVTNGTFTDSFTPFEVHAYAFGGSGSTPTPTPTPTIPNNAISFDGVDDYISISDLSTMDFDKSVGTIELWAKPVNPASGVHQLLIMDSDHEIEFSMQGNGDLFYYPWVDNAFLNYNLVTNPLIAGAWQHVAMTWEFSTKEVRIYVNGVEQILAIENVPSYWTTLASTHDWYIGGSPAKGEYFSGVIDEIRISNIVRYTSSFVPESPFAADANTVALWHFDEGQGTGAADASGNNNAGTLVNGPTWVSGCPFSQ